jgi:hypothetical protein
MVKRLLRSIRQKPKGVRDQIAFVAAVVVTGAILTTWLFYTPAGSESIESGSTEDDAPGFADIFKGFGNVISQYNADSKSSSTPVVETKPVEATEIDLSTYDQVSAGSNDQSEVAASSTESSTQEPAVAPATETSAREVQIISVESKLASTTADSSLE